MLLVAVALFCVAVADFGWCFIVSGAVDVIVLLIVTWLFCFDSDCGFGVGVIDCGAVSCFC